MSDPSKPDPRIGRILDERFRLVEFLGEGSTATVYRAESLDGGPDFAAKLVKTPSYQTPADRTRRVERFRREAMAISKLKHPNTVRLEHFGVSPGGQQYMVLEFLDGQPWSDEIRGAGRVEPPDLVDIADIGQHVAMAMEEAHRIGIVHRDLKPANIILVQQGARDLVKVVDFGAAAFDPALVNNKKLTQMGATVGSAPYMSPEQSRSEALTSASDVYSLGIVLFEALTGDVPFSGSFVEVMAQHNFNDPPRLKLAKASKKDTQGWQEVLDLMLAKAPADRPTMGQVAEHMGVLSGSRPPSEAASVPAENKKEDPPAARGDAARSEGLHPTVYLAFALMLIAVVFAIWLVAR